MSKLELPAGWGFPGASRKCHYFEAGSMESLCRKWAFFGGRRQPDEGHSSDDCAACRRELDKRKGSEA